MICVILQLRQFVAIVYAAQTGVFADGAEAFCKYDKLFTGKAVFLDRFANDLFRYTIRVYVSWILLARNLWCFVYSIPVSQVVSPRSQAAFRSGSASSSSMTHGCHLLEPMDIAPKIGTETRRPLLPSCLYSAFDSLRRPSISSLSGIVTKGGRRLQLHSKKRRSVAIVHRHCHRVNQFIDM